MTDDVTILGCLRSKSGKIEWGKLIINLHPPLYPCFPYTCQSCPLPRRPPSPAALGVPTYIDTVFTLTTCPGRHHDDRPLLMAAAVGLWRQSRRVPPPAGTNAPTCLAHLCRITFRAPISTRLARFRRPGGAAGGGGFTFVQRYGVGDGASNMLVAMW